MLQNLTYGGQIPYIPWHRRSVIAGIHWRSWQLNYSFIYVGERYHSSATYAKTTNSMVHARHGLIKNFKVKDTNLRLALEVNNLLAQDYEVVLNYPMPKRNYKLSFTVEI